LTIAVTSDRHHYSAPNHTPGRPNVHHSGGASLAYRRRRAHAIRARAVRKLPRREWERHPLMIHGAVPAGSMRARNQAQFLAAVRASTQLAHVRVDRWDSLWRVAEALALRTDWQLVTARPTWAVLMAATGLSRRSVARRLVDLQIAGLLGIVATGRSAGTDPAEPDAGNQAAVYVLAVPHALRVVTGGRRTDHDTTGVQLPQASDEQHDVADQDDQNQPPTGTGASSPAPTCADTPVDRTGTPSLSLSVTARDKPPHARMREPKPHPERASSPSTVRGLTRAQLIAAGPLCEPTERALWTKNSRLLAAAELCRLDPVLGRLSVADVASVCREWFLAGWSIRDVLTALNTRPDGSPWPHQFTVADVVHVRAWMHYRLAAWRQDPHDRTSPPARSPSARADAEQIQARARARARAEADAADRAARMPLEDRSPTAEDEMAAARAQVRRAIHTRKHRKA